MFYYAFTLSLEIHWQVSSVHSINKNINENGFQFNVREKRKKELT